MDSLNFSEACNQVAFIETTSYLVSKLCSVKLMYLHFAWRPWHGFNYMFLFWFICHSNGITLWMNFKTLSKSCLILVCVPAVRTGLEGPGLTAAQKLWYCIATVGGQYIWTRLQSFSAFRRWGDSEQVFVLNCHIFIVNCSWFWLLSCMMFLWILIDVCIFFIPEDIGATCMAFFAAYRRIL